MTSCERDILIELEAINCPHWPTMHNEELARQVGRHLTHIIKKGGLPEDAREAMHTAIFTSRTYAAQRAIDSGRIFAAALAGRASREWEELTPRQQRLHVKRAREAAAIHAGLVGGTSGNSRCSPGARQARREQLERQAAWVAGQRVFDLQSGDYFELPDPTEKKKMRLSEMVALTKGLENLIKKGGLEWARAVVTVPARMHSNPKKGKNTWDGTLPHEAARHLSKGWGDVRGRLAKFGITASGFWTREAHQDGTPHVNFILIFEPGAYPEIERAMREVFGKSKRACDVMLGGDPQAAAAAAAKGTPLATFASYAMKYFMKFFDTEPGSEAEGEDVTASAFEYRRHGFFGLPALSCWRELRRLRECPQGDPLIAGAWRACHRGDAATFIQLAGGLACARSRRPLQPLRRVVYRKKRVQVVADGPWVDIEAPAPAVVGVRHVEIDATGMPHTVAETKTRAPGRWQVISARDAWAFSAANGQEYKEKHQVTLILNYPRGEAPPPPKPRIDHVKMVDPGGSSALH